MSFPCKESLIAVENIHKCQHQIFNDSTDIGIHVAEISNYDDFKWHLKNLIDFYGSERTVCYSATTASIAIPVEQDGNFFDCIILEITYNKQNKPHHSQIKKFYNRYNSFFSIKFDRAKLEKESLKIHYNSKLFK